MNRSKREPVPRRRQETLRRAICAHLEQGPCSARDISGLVGIPEREVPAHLEHIQKSQRASGRRLLVQPALCLSCGFVFKARQRLKKPSACPRCRSQHIDPPLFRL